VLALMGCVQPAMAPDINIGRENARVFRAAGIQTLVADGAGCCGAIPDRYNHCAGAPADMRRNVDACCPLVEGLTAKGKGAAIDVAQHPPEFFAAIRFFPILEAAPLAAPLLAAADVFA